MSLSYVEVQGKLNSSQNVGHILGLSDLHLRDIGVKYEEFLKIKNETKLETPEEQITTIESSVSDIPVIQEPPVVTQPETTLEEISNTKIDNESQEVLVSDQVMAISPEPEIDSISPVVEQSVEETVIDDNNLNKAIENASMGAENFPFAQESSVLEQSTTDIQQSNEKEEDVVNISEQSEMEPENNQTQTSMFDEIQNNIISFIDVLKRREQELNAKEAELNVMAEQLKNEKINVENEKRQVLEDKLNNDQLSQVLVQTRERWEQNGVPVQNEPDYSQAQISDFSEANDVVTIQDAPEEGPTLTLSNAA